MEVKSTKKVLGSKFGPNSPKSGPKLRFFCHFLKFDSLVFFGIAYSDSFQQCLTSSRGKIEEILDRGEWGGEI